MQVIVFAPLLLILIDILTLPFNLYGHQLQTELWLLRTGWGSWFWDWTKGELIGTVIATLFVWGLYAFLRRSPRRWWFYGWLASIPVVLLLVLIQPVFIAPLFNHFEPLETKQPQLLPELEKVMHRGGLSIDRSRMFEMQASDKVTTYNAYVTGIGASKRVVVWDNTSRDLTIPETLFVFGHEQGHYVLHHIWMSLSFATFGLLLALYLAHRFADGVIARWGKRWSVRDLGDWASLPVDSAAAQRVLAGRSAGERGVLAVPGTSGRHLRTRSHSRPRTDSPQAAAHAFQKLGEKALSYPGTESAVRDVGVRPSADRRSHPVRRAIPAVERQSADALHRAVAAAPTPTS